MGGHVPTVVDLVRLPTVPWRNGAGVTREVLVGGPDDRHRPAWRLSLADVNRRSSYSTFLDTDRSSCVVSGNGLRLLVDGEEVAAGRGDVVTYAGESAVEAWPVDGGVGNLNVFARRGCATARMWVQSADGATSWPPWTALFLLHGAATSPDGSDWMPSELVLVRDLPWSCRADDACFLVVDVPPGTRPSGEVEIG